MSKVYLVTGGCGFIGSNFIHFLMKSETDIAVVNLDKLTYAGNPRNLEDIESDPRYTFVHGDICDGNQVREIFESAHPEVVINFAAESHVDRSISGPGDFINTNIVGTYQLLNEALNYFHELATPDQKRFRFHHVSTDEVYGSLGDEGYFTEETAYDPSSPYSASKASSDHLVRAWQRTFGLPVLITNCSNNYGPYQFPEKLIPLMILNCLEGKPLPVYGDGQNIRDWLYVDDHCDAILQVIQNGTIGETYNIGGNNEIRNLDIVQTICDILDEYRPNPKLKSHRDLITFVKDRPGHDFRYAIDATKIKTDLGWTPQHTFTAGIRETVKWYLKNEPWWEFIRSGEYLNYYHQQYRSLNAI